MKSNKSSLGIALLAATVAIAVSGCNKTKSYQKDRASATMTKDCNTGMGMSTGAGMSTGMEMSGHSAKDRISNYK